MDFTETSPDCPTVDRRTVPLVAAAPTLDTIDCSTACLSVPRLNAFGCSPAPPRDAAHVTELLAHARRASAVRCRAARLPLSPSDSAAARTSAASPASPLL